MDSGFITTLLFISLLLPSLGLVHNVEKICMEAGNEDGDHEDANNEHKEMDVDREDVDDDCEDVDDDQDDVDDAYEDVDDEHEEEDGTHVIYSFNYWF